MKTTVAEDGRDPSAGDTAHATVWSGIEKFCVDDSQDPAQTEADLTNCNTANYEAVDLPVSLNAINVTSYPSFTDTTLEDAIDGFDPSSDSILDILPAI